MNAQISNTTRFLWNTPYGLAIAINGYTTQTTRVQFYNGAPDGDRTADSNWIDIEGSQSSGPSFQEVIDPPSKELRIKVDNPDGLLNVVFSRKR